MRDFARPTDRRCHACCLPIPRKEEVYAYRFHSDFLCEQCLHTQAIPVVLTDCCKKLIVWPGEKNKVKVCGRGRKHIQCLPGTCARVKLYENCPTCRYGSLRQLCAQQIGTKRLAKQLPLHIRQQVTRSSA